MNETYFRLRPSSSNVRQLHPLTPRMPVRLHCTLISSHRDPSCEHANGNGYIFSQYAQIGKGVARFRARAVNALNLR